MNRLMLRAIARSKIPIWYTEGFNPHPFITFALPLSLGFTSDYEIMDFKLDESMTNEECALALSKVMPQSIEVIEVCDLTQKVKEISFAKFEIEVEADKENSNKLIEFLNNEIIEVEKSTKKKEIKVYNVKPKIKDLNLERTDSGIKLDLVLPAGSTENVNPMLIFESAKKAGLEFNVLSYNRSCLMNSNMALFR